MKKRILFTGGSGKAGRHAVPWLVNAGYEVHNVDLVPLESPGVTNLTADITDSGQMFNVLSMHRDFRIWTRARVFSLSTPLCISRQCRASLSSLITRPSALTRWALIMSSRRP